MTSIVHTYNDGYHKKSNILLALIFESSKEKLTLPYLHYLLNQLPLTQFSMWGVYQTWNFTWMSNLKWKNKNVPPHFSFLGNALFSTPHLCHFRGSNLDSDFTSKIVIDRSFSILRNKQNWKISTRLKVIQGV